MMICTMLILLSSNLTMEELLVSLTKKARLECEEAHRQYVFANNALAAICIINGKVGSCMLYFVLLS